MDIIWVVPLPSNSDHRDYFMFSRESVYINHYKPSFATITGKGDNPKYNVLASKLPILGSFTHPTLPLIGNPDNGYINPYYRGR